MKVLTLVTRRRVALPIALVLIALPLWWFAWMAPAGEKHAAAVQQEQTAQSTRSSLLERLAELREDKAEDNAAKQYLARFGNAVPALPDAPGLVEEVYGLAQRDGVKLASITDNSVVGVGAYSKIPVSISVSGGRDGLVSFVNGLYSLPRLVTVQSLGLSGSGNLAQPGNQAMTASITATAYTLLVSDASNTPTS